MFAGTHPAMGSRSPTRIAPGDAVSTKGVDAPDLATVKDFLRFLGIMDKEGRIMADSLNTFAEWFFAGFTRVTSTPTDERDRSEVYNVGTFPHRSWETNLAISSRPDNLDRRGCSGEQKETEA
jgi:hypothetical protein